MSYVEFCFPGQTAGLPTEGTNTTDYTDPYVAYMDEK